MMGRRKIKFTCGGRTFDGLVLIASPNQRSLVISFEGAVDGHLGIMALHTPDGWPEAGTAYESLITGTRIEVEFLPESRSDFVAGIMGVCPLAEPGEPPGPECTVCTLRLILPDSPEDWPAVEAGAILICRPCALLVAGMMKQNPAQVLEWGERALELTVARAREQFMSRGERHADA